MSYIDIKKENLHFLDILYPREKKAVELRIGAHGKRCSYREIGEFVTHYLTEKPLSAERIRQMILKSVRKLRKFGCPIEVYESNKK